MVDPPLNDRPRLELQPDASSAAAARRFVRHVLRAFATPELIDSASLVASELVTNAVLHARTTVRLSVTGLAGGGVRLEVTDESRQNVQPRHYAEDSGTGRGLVLVDALAGRWGVDDLVEGKTVWVELGVSAPETEATNLAGGTAASALLPPSGAAGSPRPSAAAGGEALVTVEVLGLPVDLYRQSAEHNDELLREFALILERDPSEGSEPPGRLLGLIGELNQRFGAFGGSARQRMEAALDGGEERIDLHYEVPVDIGPAAARLSDLFEEADSYCRAGQLLTLATPPAALAMRRWFLDQFRVQAAGGQPESWERWWERRQLEDTQPI